MNSAFAFSPSALADKLSGAHSDKLSGAHSDKLSGAPALRCDLVHVSCLPYLLGEPLPERTPDRGGSPKILVSFPFISKGAAYRAFCDRFEEFAERFDGFTVQNLGDFWMLCELLEGSKKVRREDLIIAGDAALNVTNASTAAFWSGKLDVCAILPELGVSEHLELIKRFPSGLIPEVLLDAQKIVMRSEHCFAARGNAYKCGKCGKTGLLGGSIFDISGNEFPIITNPLDCNSILLCPPAANASSASLFDLSPDTFYFRVL